MYTQLSKGSKKSGGGSKQSESSKTKAKSAENPKPSTTEKKKVAPQAQQSIQPLPDVAMKSSKGMVPTPKRRSSISKESNANTETEIILKNSIPSLPPPPPQIKTNALAPSAPKGPPPPMKALPPVDLLPASNTVSLQKAGPPSPPSVEASLLLDQLANSSATEAPPPPPPSLSLKKMKKLPKPPTEKLTKKKMERRNSMSRLLKVDDQMEQSYTYDPVVKSQRQVTYSLSNVLAPDVLLAQKRRLKKIDRKENFAPVKLYRRDFYNNLTDQDPEFLPIAEVKAVIISQSLAADITQLHFSGIEQMTDFMFYILLISKGNFRSVNKLECKGCIHLTDQGIKWASQAFPNLQALIVDGCQKLTEKSMYHLVTDHSDCTYIEYSSTDVACLPPEIMGTKINRISLLGAPVISMCPGISLIERRGIRGTRKPHQEAVYNPIMTHKAVIILDQDIDYSIGGLIDGKTKNRPKGTFHYWNKILTTEKGNIFNAFEVCADNPLMDKLISDGSIVVISYRVTGKQDTVSLSKRLALTIASILCKCPYVMFVLVGIEDESVNNALGEDQIREAVMHWLGVWRSSVIKEVEGITLRDWRIEQLDFAGQIMFTAGVKTAEEIAGLTSTQFQSRTVKKVDFSCLIVHWLDNAVDGKHNIFKWMPKTLQEHCFQAFSEIPHVTFSNQLELSRTMKEETVKLFDCYESFPIMGKLIEFLEKQGDAMLWKDDDFKNNCFMDISALNTLVSSMMDSKRTTLADVPCVSDQPLPVWTEANLTEILSKSVPSDKVADVIEFLVELNLLVALRCEQNELDLTVSGPLPRVYIPYNSIPDEPIVDLVSLWPQNLPDKCFQRDKIYTFVPGLPKSLFPIFLRKCSEIFSFSLLWKSGVLIQHGPVDILIDITANKHKYYEEAPVIAVSGRIALWDQLQESQKESSQYDGQCLWAVINIVTKILDSVCVELETYALITIPCLTCVPNRNRKAMLGNYSCYHFNQYVFLAGFDRGMECRREKGSKYVKKEEVIGKDMPSLVPYHNYHFMKESNSLLNKDDSLFPCGVPKDPFGEKQCWKCFNCWRKNELVCHCCGWCQYCISFLAKIDRTVRPGVVCSKHYHVKDYNTGSSHSKKNVNAKKADEDLEEEMADEEDDKQKVDVGKDIEAKSLFSGCLITLLPQQNLRIQQFMDVSYFNEFSLVIITGKQFILTLGFNKDKKIRYNASCGIFVDQKGTQHKEIEYKAHTGDLFTLRLYPADNGGMLVCYYLRKRKIYQEEIQAIQLSVFLRTGRKASYFLHSPGIKMNWQYRPTADFVAGMKVEIKDQSGNIKQATIQDASTGQLTILADGEEAPVSMERARGNIRPLKSKSDDDDTTDENNIAPLWLFNESQTGGKLVEMLKGKKAEDLIYKCTDVLLPSALYSRMKLFEPEIEDVVFRQGSIDFSGSAYLLIPENMKQKDLFYSSNLLLTQSLHCQPLCYQRGDMHSVMTMRPVQYLSKTITPYRLVHMLNADGFTFTNTAGNVDSFFDNNKYDETIILWAWHLIALSKQEPVALELSKVLKNVEGLSSISKTKLTNVIYRLLLRMCFHLYFGLGPLFDPTTFNKNNEELHIAAKEMKGMLLDNLDKSNLEKVSIMFSEDEVYMCSAHAACWQISRHLADVPLDFLKENTMYIKSLHLQENQISSLPEEMFVNLPNLMDLDISMNILPKIPDAIGNCGKLLSLTVAGNKLTTLPDSMASCHRLERFDISGNLMKEIPAVVTKLGSLTRLYAQNMQLTHLPEDIGNLTKLDKLGLNGNCFTFLPKSFSNLKNLTELFLNGIPWYKAKPNTIVSKEHFEETLHTAGLQNWLKEHDQDKIAIFKYFDEDTNGTLDQKELGKLNATMFNVFPRFGYKGAEPPDEDMPSGFPPEIFDLPKLTYLGMQFHGFISVPEEIGQLTNLATINFSHNPNLLSIPAQLSNLPLKRLEIEDCPILKTPPKEIRAKGFATTIAYLRRLLSGSCECMRTKLMIVGLGGAGKSSLVKALLSDKSKAELSIGEDITDGIDIYPWKVQTEEGELTYSIWDFAGQTVYYNTHQFFLSDRAVYLLLWNVRLGNEHAGLDFWLNSIKVHAPKAPIFVVGSHIDQVSKAELPLKAMRAKYPQIAGFHYISSHTGQGVDDLKKNLVEETLKQQYIGEKIPGVWLALEKSIQEIQSKCVIEYSELEKRANMSGVFDKSEVAQAVQFLHELGSLQYFQNEFLKSYVVINPQWIVDVMACIVSVKDCAIKNGRLHHGDISKVWSEYPENLHWWLLRLTEEFDLTFRLSDEPVNIVPCLLPEKEPEIIWPEIEKNSGMKENKMVYMFDYLPAGLFNRGQVRLNQFSDSSFIWKRGSFLKKNEHICLVKQTKQSELVVIAQGARPDNVLFLVHEVFEGLISESFQGVNYDFNVPCPHCQKQMIKEPYMFAASTVKRANELKAPFLQCMKYFHPVSIIDLQAVMPPDSNIDYDLHLVQAVNGLKELHKDLSSDILLSYCAKDIRIRNEECVPTKTIITDLKQAGYKCWFKEDGSVFTTDEIARALIDSKVFVALISNNYVKDETCCNLFKYARLTLQKPTVIIAIGDSLDWKKSRLGILLSDQVFVDMRKLERYKHKFPELLNTIETRLNKTPQKVSPPPCFLSYAWQNSKEAVDKGSRYIQGAVGKVDPRAIKEYLEKNDVKCWIDIERAGTNGLFDDIAEGLREADVMIACISDEYAISPNCQIEFRYALNTLKLPIILAVVGTGSKWRATEIGFLSRECPIINFQEKSEFSYPKLLELVKKHLPEREEKKDNQKQPETINTNLSFQELFELAQRKFLRQIMLYAEKQDIRPYPRLFVTDFVKDKKEHTDDDVKEEGEAKEGLKKRQSGITVYDDPNNFHKQKYTVNILCESDEGWHYSCDPLPLPEDFGTTSLEKFSPYIARITAIAKYNKHLLLNCLETEEGQKFLKWLEESPNIAANSDFEEVYYELRQEVIQADVERKMGHLARCHLPNGKTIWLCEKHQKSMRVTVLSDEIVTSVNIASEGLTTDYMIQALRDLDLLKVSLKFKEQKRIVSAKPKRGKIIQTEKQDQASSSENPIRKSSSSSQGNSDKTSKTDQTSSRLSQEGQSSSKAGQSASNTTNSSKEKPPLNRQLSKACSIM